MVFFASILLAVAVLVVTFLILPKPKTAKPAAAKDIDNPTSEAGREIPVVFGTVTIKGLNVLDFCDKNIRSYEVKS